jgi:predicted Zn-dependent protease
MDIDWPLTVFLTIGMLAASWRAGSWRRRLPSVSKWRRRLERRAKIVDDPVTAEYVNRVGQNLVRNSYAKIPFTIKVLDSEEVNAFALPGGFFFVNSGLILQADNEAALAGVMAHEIAHVAARHEAGYARCR